MRRVVSHGRQTPSGTCRAGFVRGWLPGSAPTATRPAPSQRKAAQRAAGVNAGARVAGLRAVVDVVRWRKAGTPVARSEKRLTTGGRSAWPAAPGPGGRLGLEDGLNSGGEELCGLCVDGDAPAEQHAANDAACMLGHILWADGDV